MHIYLNLKWKNRHSMKMKKTTPKTFHHAFPLLDPVLSVLTCHGF